MHDSSGIPNSCAYSALHRPYPKGVFAFDAAEPMFYSSLYFNAISPVSFYFADYKKFECFDMNSKYFAI